MDRLGNLILFIKYSLALRYMGTRHLGQNKKTVLMGSRMQIYLILLSYKMKL